MLTSGTKFGRANSLLEKIFEFCVSILLIELGLWEDIH